MVSVQFGFNLVEFFIVVPILKLLFFKSTFFVLHDCVFKRKGRRVGAKLAKDFQQKNNEIYSLRSSRLLRELCGIFFKSFFRFKLLQHLFCIFIICIQFQ